MICSLILSEKTIGVKKSNAKTTANVIPEYLAIFNKIDLDLFFDINNIEKLFEIMIKEEDYP
ncbi:hypothetical protein GCM10011518_05000 [Flavobacterium limi]|uniref:Uncharacterized protein n=1 Tax=Flavobacterium limi TaxID=2045105 RepID=A0ABQ1TPP9_9FLAO|nr:hypothetical protein GCM10011518_05000 [Flavobacterium limi]